MRSLRYWLGLLLLLMHAAAHALVDIVVNQTDSPDPIGAGGLLTYTIVVTNNGPDNATGVVLTDTIPASSTFSSVSTTKGSCSGTTTVTCTIGALTVGESATVQLRVVPNTIGTLTNTVASTRNEPDSNAANNSDTDITTVQAGTDLRILKTDSADPVSQGDTFSYALNVTNLGPYAHGASDTLTVTDNIPVGIRVNSVPTGTGWSCSPAAGYPLNGPFTLTCTRTGAIAIGASAPSVSVPVTALSLGTITNQVTVSSTLRDDNTANNTATQSTTVNQAADVAVAKAVSQAGNLGVGQDYSYTLSPTLVLGTTGTITITDNLPAGLQLTATPTGTDWSCSPNSGFPVAGPVTVSCTRAGLSHSGLTPLSLNDISIPFRPTATGGLSNTATINPGVTDFNNSNNTSNTVSSTVINDTGITKGVSQAGNIGQNGTYTYTLTPFITMGTTGPVITVTDNVPAGVTLLSAPAGTGWACSPSSGFPLAGPLTVTCTRAGSGNPGPASQNLPAISFTFSPTATGILSNTASVASGAADTNGGNDSSTVTNTVLNDLAVAKTVNTSGLLGQGSTYTYTLSGSLVMGDSGGAITLTDSLPAGVNLTTAPTGTGWTCTPSSGFPLAGPQTISCTRPSATNNGPGALSFPNVTFNFVPTAAPGTNITNSVTIGSPAADTNATNNSSAVTRQVAAPGTANLSIDKIATNTGGTEISSTSVGTGFRYRLRVTNNGPANKPAGQVVTVTDVVPVGVTFTSLQSAVNWSCTVNNPPGNAYPVAGNGSNSVTCTRSGALNNGSSYNDITFNAIGTVGGLVTNTGTVSAAFGSSSESADMTFSAAFDLVSSKSDTAGGYGPDPVALGDTVDYRLRVTNNGPNNVPAGVTLSLADTIPAGTTYISGTGVTPAHGWTCPPGPVTGSATITCTRTVTGLSGNTLNNGENSDVRFTLRADTLATINNAAEVQVTAGPSETNSANNTSAQSTNVRSSADLSITKTASVASLYAGDLLTYTVTVTNNGPAATDINNVSVRDDMRTNPGGTFVSVTPAQPGWNCNNILNLTCDYNNSLAAGASVSFDVTIRPSVPGNPRNNTASVAFRRAGATLPVDPDPANNSATVGVTVLDSVDLFVTKSDAPDPVRAGTDLTYVITVGNSGPGTATPVTLTDTLPADLVLRAISPSGSGSCTTTPVSATYTSSSTTVSPPAAFTTLTCTWPSLAAASQQTVTVIGRPTSAAALAGSISNSASVSHGNSGSVPDITRPTTQSRS